MSMDDQISNTLKFVPECVACGVVDIDTGMLLGIKTLDSHPQEVIDYVAAATGDLFQGPNVTAIENLFKKVRGVKESSHHYFQEIIITSDNLLHVFMRGKKNESIVFIIVCRISANLGMVLTKSRLASPKLEAAL